MNAYHDDKGSYEKRAQRRPRSAAEEFVRVDAIDEEAFARCEAAVFIGKALAADPDLRWAYDEAAQIAAGSPLQSRGTSMHAARMRIARVRAALAHPGVAWSAAALSTIVAIGLLWGSPRGTPPEGAAADDAPPSVGSELHANGLRASGETFAAASDSGSGASDSAGHPISLDSRAAVTDMPALSDFASTPPPAPTPSTAYSAPAAATPSAARYSPSSVDTGFDTAPASPVVVLPDRVFVDARSVAVMPFVIDASGSPPPQISPRARAMASDLYADVVERLESIPGFYVAQPVSVMPYANTDLGTGEIASQLGVRGIIEGRVAAAAGRVRVTLSLTDAASDDVMWRGTIERSADAVAEIGANMAANVAAALANADRSTVGAATY